MSGSIPLREESRPASEGRVVELGPADAPRWAEFAGRHPSARIYHHPEWLEALAAAYACRPVCLGYETAAHGLVGVLPLASSLGVLTGRRLSSLPHTPVAGPLASDPVATLALVQAARGLAQRLRARLEIRLPEAAPFASGRDPLVASDPIYVRALPDDPGLLRFGNSRNHARVKWSVQHAQREGVTLRKGEGEADLRTWYRLYLVAMRRHAHPPIPYRFFVELLRRLAPLDLMELILAERTLPDGRREALAGSVFLRFSSTVTYAYNGRTPGALHARANDLIQWRAIHDAVAQGYRRYDFGEVPSGQQGLADFKAKWGGAPTTPYRYGPGAREDSRPGGGLRGELRERLDATWERLPLAATEQIGKILYRIG